MEIEKLASIAIDCGLRIHRSLGPGLLESAYEAVLADALQRAGITVRRQQLVPIQFENLVIDNGFRADLILDGQLLIELKSVERLAPVHAKQLLTYLRLMDLRLGLLMNFGAETFRDGLKRVVNRHVDDAASPLRIAAAGSH